MNKTMDFLPTYLLVRKKEMQRHQHVCQDIKETYNEYPEFWIAAIGTGGFSLCLHYIVSYLTLENNTSSKCHPTTRKHGKS